MPSKGLWLHFPTERWECESPFITQFASHNKAPRTHHLRFATQRTWRVKISEAKALRIIFQGSIKKWPISRWPTDFSPKRSRGWCKCTHTWSRCQVGHLAEEEVVKCAREWACVCESQLPASALLFRRQIVRSWDGRSFRLPLQGGSTNCGSSSVAARHWLITHSNQRQL